MTTPPPSEERKPCTHVERRWTCDECVMTHPRVVAALRASEAALATMTKERDRAIAEREHYCTRLGQEQQARCNTEARLVILQSRETASRAEATKAALEKAAKIMCFQCMMGRGQPQHHTRGTPGWWHAPTESWGWTHCESGPIHGALASLAPSSPPPPDTPFAPSPAQVWSVTEAALGRMVEHATEAERERCAKIAEGEFGFPHRERIAASIRGSSPAPEESAVERVKALVRKVGGVEAKRRIEAFVAEPPASPAVSEPAPDVYLPRRCGCGAALGRDGRCEFMWPEPPAPLPAEPPTIVRCPKCLRGEPIVPAPPSEERMKQAEMLARLILAPMIEDAEDVRMPLRVAKLMSVPAVTAKIAEALQASEASLSSMTKERDELRLTVRKLEETHAQKDHALRTRSDYDLQCGDCGAPHNLDTSIPSDLWNAIAPEGGVLCTLCIEDRLIKAGLTCDVAEFYYVGPALQSRAYAESTGQIQAAREHATEAEEYRQAVVTIQETLAKEGLFTKAIRDNFAQGILAAIRGSSPAVSEPAHQHRFITDEDGAVHGCRCGVPYVPEPPAPLPAEPPRHDFSLPFRPLCFCPDDCEIHPPGPAPSKEKP